MARLARADRAPLKTLPAVTSLHAEDKAYRAFDVYNLGRYECQWCQKERLHGADDEHRPVVLGFYKAEPTTHVWTPRATGELSAQRDRRLVNHAVASSASGAVFFAAGLA